MSPPFAAANLAAMLHAEVVVGGGRILLGADRSAARL
jgi:hypothetical protein